MMKRGLLLILILLALFSFGSLVAANVCHTDDDCACCLAGNRAIGGADCSTVCNKGSSSGDSTSVRIIYTRPYHTEAVQQKALDDIRRLHQEADHDSDERDAAAAMHDRQRQNDEAAHARNALKGVDDPEDGNTASFDLFHAWDLHKRAVLAHLKQGVKDSPEDARKKEVLNWCKGHVPLLQGPEVARDRWEGRCNGDHAVAAFSVEGHALGAELFPRGKSPSSGDLALKNIDEGLSPKPKARRPNQKKIDEHSPRSDAAPAPVAPPPARSGVDRHEQLTDVKGAKEKISPTSGLETENLEGLHEEGAAGIDRKGSVAAEPSKAVDLKGASGGTVPMLAEGQRARFHPTPSFPPANTPTAYGTEGRKTVKVAALPPVRSRASSPAKAGVPQPGDLDLLFPKDGSLGQPRPAAENPYLNPAAKERISQLTEKQKQDEDRRLLAIFNSPAGRKMADEQWLKRINDSPQDPRPEVNAALKEMNQRLDLHEKKTRDQVVDKFLIFVGKLRKDGKLGPDEDLEDRCRRDAGLRSIVETKSKQLLEKSAADILNYQAAEEKRFEEKVANLGK